MRIIIVGGHLAPALAVIQKLPEKTEVLYIGRKYALEGDKALSLEYQKITSMGIPFVDLKTGRLQRKFTKYTFSSLLKLPLGSLQALKVLMMNRPDCVVCFGGYVQVPVAFAAQMLGIPIVMHEQTRKAGLANKIIAPFATFVCISWEESKKYFPKNKTVLTGIPLRQEFLDVVEKNVTLEKSASSIRTIYITGGSLGAHGINLLVEGCIERLLENFYVIHQTGDAKEYQDYDRLERFRGDRYKLVKFIDPDEAARTMASADLVISRSGMNTTAELLFLNKPCILIPLPHSQNNEQLENALFLQEQGFAKVLEQEGLTSEILYSQIRSITDKLDKVDKSSRANNYSPLQVTPYDAAEKIVQIITQVYKQKNQEKKDSSSF